MWWIKALIIVLFALAGVVLGFGIPFLMAVTSKNEGAGQALSFFPILTVPLGMLVFIILSIFYISNVDEFSKSNFLQFQFLWGYPILLIGLGGLLTLLWMFGQGAAQNARDTEVARSYKAKIKKDFDDEKWQEGFDKLFALASKNGFDVFAAERANINGLLYNMVREGTEDLSKFPPEALEVLLSRVAVRNCYIDIPLMHSKWPDPKKFMGILKSYIDKRYEDLPERNALKTKFIVDLYGFCKNDSFKNKLPKDLAFVSSFPFDYDQRESPISHEFEDLNKVYDDFGNVLDFFLLGSLWITPENDLEPYFKKVFKFLNDKGVKPSLNKATITKQYDLYRTAGDL